MDNIRCLLGGNQRGNAGTEPEIRKNVSAKARRWKETSAKTPSARGDILRSANWMSIESGPQRIWGGQQYSSIFSGVGGSGILRKDLGQGTGKI